MARTLQYVSEDDNETDEKLPELTGVKIMTEERISVPDDVTDPFLRSFEPEQFATEKLYKSFEKGLENRTGSAKSKQYVDGEQISMYGVLDVVDVPYNQFYLAKLYETNSIHAAAIDAKIDNIAGLGYYWDFSRKADKIRQKAARKDDDDAKQKVEDRLIDDRHSLDDFISDLNKFDEFDEILEKVLRDRFTTGNGYLEIGRTKDGRIGYLGHIPSVNMRVRRPRDGFVQYIGEKPVFFRNFGDQKTRDPFGLDSQPNEVIHYKKYSPTNTYYGVPEIVSATDNIAGIEFANQYNIEYFENKAVPRYIITTSGVTIGKATHAELLRFFETNTKGKSHRSLLIPLPNLNAKVEFTPVETKKQEASFVEYISQNTQHILARHRVPANRLGMSGGTGIGDSRDANKMFKETVCNPEQRLIEKKLGRVFRELTDLFTFKLSQFTLTDENEQSQIHERQLRMGEKTPDEVREEMGMPPRPDGNGDQALDVRALQELAQASAEKMQSVTIKSTEKVAAASQKASVEAAKVAPKPVVGGVAGKAASAQKAVAGQTRTRDANRSSNKTDGVGATQSRNAKGTGAKKS